MPARTVVLGLAKPFLLNRKSKSHNCYLSKVLVTHSALMQHSCSTVTHTVFLMFGWTGHLSAILNRPIHANMLIPQPFVSWTGSLLSLGGAHTCLLTGASSCAQAHYCKCCVHLTTQSAGLQQKLDTELVIYSLPNNFKISILRSPIQEYQNLEKAVFTTHNQYSAYMQTLSPFYNHFHSNMALHCQKVFVCAKTNLNLFFY